MDQPREIGLVNNRSTQGRHTSVTWHTLVTVTCARFLKPKTLAIWDDIDTCSHPNQPNFIQRNVTGCCSIDTYLKILVLCFHFGAKILDHEYVASPVVSDL